MYLLTGKLHSITIAPKTKIIFEKELITLGVAPTTNWVLPRLICGPALSWQTHSDKPRKEKCKSNLSDIVKLHIVDNSPNRNIRSAQMLQSKINTIQVSESLQTICGRPYVSGPDHRPKMVRGLGWFSFWPTKERTQKSLLMTRNSKLTWHQPSYAGVEGFTFVSHFNLLALTIKVEEPAKGGAHKVHVGHWRRVMLFKWFLNWKTDMQITGCDLETSD